MDQFSEQYQDLIEGSYDCVDRIVLNAYFAMGKILGACACGGGRCPAQMKLYSTVSVQAPPQSSDA